MHSSDCHLGSDLRDDASERRVAALVDATLASGAACLVIR